MKKLYKYHHSNFDTEGENQDHFSWVGYKSSKFRTEAAIDYLCQHLSHSKEDWTDWYISIDKIKK